MYFLLIHFADQRNPSLAGWSSSQSTAHNAPRARLYLPLHYRYGRGCARELGPLVRVQRLDPQTGRRPRVGIEGQVQLPQEVDREVEEAGGAAME